MVRFISAIFSFCLAVGVGEALVHMNYQMATKAEHAFLHDQVSYAAFTQAMINAKPRTAPKRPREKPTTPADR